MTPIWQQHLKIGNVDKKTEDYIRHSSPPRQLVKKVFKEEQPWAEDRTKLQDLARDHRLSGTQKDKIKTLIEANESRGLYDKKKVEVDKEAGARLEKYHEDYIKRGIAEGHIKRFDPSKDPQAARLLRMSQKEK